MQKPSLKGGNFAQPSAKRMQKGEDMEKIEQAIITNEWIILKYEYHTLYLSGELGKDFLDFITLIIDEEELKALLFFV